MNMICKFSINKDNSFISINIIVSRNDRCFVICRVEMIGPSHSDE